MASVYSTEPPTSGKVILKTNYGNIDIELWTKEAPRACRNFIQLCLEDYYNNIIFHRIIKGFMIQTGDPTGKGQGGESIWNKDFPDEFHSRLRFARRGMVAMANKNKPNTNSSQFFVTMEKCPWLEKKHTIFGKITGDTIFNAINISHLPTENDFPIDDIMPKIIGTEVIINPFIDIVPREKKILKNAERQDAEEIKIFDKKELQSKKLERLCNNNLISFDEEELGLGEDNSQGFVLNKNKKFGIKPFPGLKEEKKNKNKNKIKENKIEINNINTSKVKLDKENFVNKPYEITLEESFLDEAGLDEEKLLNYLQFKQENKIIKPLNNQVDTNKNIRNIKESLSLSKDDSDSISESESLSEENNMESELLNKKILEEQMLLKESNKDLNLNFDFDADRKEEIQKIKNDIQSIKKRIKNNTEGIKEEEEKEKLTPLQEMRLKYTNNKRKRNPKDNVQKMEKFVNNLKSITKEEGNWMSNKLKFHTDSQKAFSMNDTKEKVLRNFDLNNS